MFLSKDYAVKAWTTLERQNAQQAFKKNKEYILPIKLMTQKSQVFNNYWLFI
jgi:hypothetical protein